MWTKTLTFGGIVLAAALLCAPTASFAQRPPATKPARALPPKPSPASPARGVDWHKLVADHEAGKAATDLQGAPATDTPAAGSTGPTPSAPASDRELLVPPVAIGVLEAAEFLKSLVHGPRITLTWN